MKAFSSFHPIVLVLYFGVVLITSMFASHPVILIEALLSGILLNIMLSERKNILSDLGFYLFLFIVITLTNPLFSHNGATPLFFLNGNAITKEALISGLSIATLLTGVIYWFKCYSIIMSSDKFLYIFGRTIPKLSLIFSMVLRFLPLFKVQMRKVGNAQKAMGLYSGDKYMDKVKSQLSVFSVMITWALENAVETGDSMKARGYGLKGKSHYSLFRFKKVDAVMLVVIGVICIFLVTGLASSSIKFNYYPKVDNVKFGILSVATYISFGVLAFLPFFVEIKEKIKWNYFVSKI